MTSISVDTVFPYTNLIIVLRRPMPIAGRMQLPIQISSNVPVDVQPVDPLAQVRDQLPGVPSEVLYTWFDIYTVGADKPDILVNDDVQDPAVYDRVSGGPVTWHVHGVRDWGDYLEIRAQKLNSPVAPSSGT